MGKTSKHSVRKSLVIDENDLNQILEEIWNIMLEHYTESDLAILQDFNAWTGMIPNPEVTKT
jgi:hypothetical protein